MKVGISLLGNIFSSKYSYMSILQSCLCWTLKSSYDTKPIIKSTGPILMQEAKPPEFPNPTCNLYKVVSLLNAKLHFLTFYGECPVY